MYAAITTKEESSSRFTLQELQKTFPVKEYLPLPPTPKKVKDLGIEGDVDKSGV